MPERKDETPTTFDLLSKTEERFQMEPIYLKKISDGTEGLLDAEWQESLC